MTKTIKEQAHHLVNLARRRNVLLPKDDREARMRVGTILMSRRLGAEDFDMEAALQDVEKRFGIGKQPIKITDSDDDSDVIVVDEKISVDESEMKEDYQIPKRRKKKPEVAQPTDTGLQKVQELPSQKVDYEIPKKKKKKVKAEIPQETPRQEMPDFNKKSTEDLNFLISKYGMKPSSSRSFMIKKLEEIWAAKSKKRESMKISPDRVKKSKSKSTDGVAKKKQKIKASQDSFEAESPPKTKKKKSKTEEFACEENRPLAKAFLEMGGYAFKEDSRFQGASYMKAGKAIREFPEVITSGKQMKPVKGIGPAIMSKIDEFLNTGVIEKLQEYKAVHG